MSNINFGGGFGGGGSVSRGFVDYNDLASLSTPLDIPGTGVLVTVPNDTLGPFTNELFLPSGITSIFSSNQFNWSQLQLGDTVDIRLDLKLTTISPNTEVACSLFLAIGGNEYEIPFITDSNFKSVGDHSLIRFNSVYIGDGNTLNNPAEFRFKSDSNCSVTVNGWYCKILRG